MVAEKTKSPILRAALFGCCLWLLFPAAGAQQVDIREEGSLQAESNERSDSAFLAPDTLKGEDTTFYRHTAADSVDSAHTGLVRRLPPQSAPLPDSLEHRPHIQFGVQLGAAFLDFNERELFANHLSALAGQNSKAVLQSYEEAHLAFPVGLIASFPIGSRFDILAEGHGFWYRQVGIIGDSSESRNFTYAMQSALLGLGLRFYLPREFIEVDQFGLLHAEFTWFWDPGMAEIYSDFGSINSRFEPGGSGFRAALGMQRSTWKNWVLLGSLGISNLSFQSNDPWQKVVPLANAEVANTAPDPAPARWELNSLGINLRLVRRWGGDPPKAEESHRPETNSDP